MEREFMCEGVTVDQIAQFLEREGGKTVPAPDGGKVRILRMKIDQRSTGMLVMKRWKLTWICIAVGDNCKITVEARWLTEFWSVVILSAFMFWLGYTYIGTIFALNALLTIVANYFIWPKKWDKINAAIAAGAKNIE